MEKEGGGKCSISVLKRSEAVREDRSLIGIGGADKETLHKITGKGGGEGRKKKVKRLKEKWKKWEKQTESRNGSEMEKEGGRRKQTSRSWIKSE